MDVHPAGDEQGTMRWGMSALGAEIAAMLGRQVVRGKAGHPVVGSIESMPDYPCPETSAQNQQAP